MSLSWSPTKATRLPIPKGKCKQGIEIVKYVGSTLLTLSCLGIIMYGIGKGYAVLPGSPIVHYLLLLFVVVLLAYLEGLQVAILTLEHRDVSHYESLYPRGCRLQKLLSKGKNVARFLMGRQFFVIFVVFLCAQLTTFPTLEIPGMPEWLFIILIDTGLPGALVVLAFGQLMPQLVAQCDPMFVMNVPGSRAVVNLTLALEFVGVTHFSWVLSASIMWLRSLPRTIKAEDNQHSRRCSLLDNLLSVDMISDLVVSMKDLDKALVESIAEEGMQPSSPKPKHIDQINRENSSWARAMEGWCHGPNGDVYSPFHIANHLAVSNKPIPRFLLPPTHYKHIPPHLVAYELMRRTARLKEENECLRQQLAATEGAIDPAAEGSEATAAAEEVAVTIH